jgi:hypothetical protein
MPPLRIKLVEPDYMVSSLEDDVHSLFGGKSPKEGKTEARERGYSAQTEIVSADGIHSPFSGRKPQRREDTARKQTNSRKYQGIANPTLEGPIQQEAEG